MDHIPSGIAPPQPIAIDEDNPTQHAPVIDAWRAMALGKERLKAFDLRLSQPKQVAHECDLLAELESRQQPEINGSGA